MSLFYRLPITPIGNTDNALPNENFSAIAACFSAIVLAIFPGISEINTTVRASDFILSTPEINIYAIRASFVITVTAIFFPVMPGMLVLNQH
ncbi:hypothetical protein HHJ81_03595 [Mobiluncus mulieris]|uniref:hypothetical protein n=1 Tax=Mobiluncus mulieris TaxID=2052 RepID=UPI001470502B|nr:hypothetical protein [Mobiluncus mulieris]NMW60187.1 hypothetical protein [Mobiluncus mulieris]